MPGDSPFDAIWQQFVGSAKRTARQALPRCNVCDATALPVPCLVCGEFSCHDHGFFRIAAAQHVCSLCVDEMSDEIDVSPAPPGGAPRVRGPDPWDVLGIDPGASADEVKRAFRQLARERHPDVDHSPGAAERFAELRRAYQVALDSAQRGSR